MHEKQKYGLGSGGLSANHNTDFNEEYKQIQKEKIRLKIQ
jgi:hypothetical protein